MYELWKESSENLDGTQGQQLRELLGKHVNVFSLSDDDMDRTDVLKHKIDTGSAKPIRQAPRRLPIHQQAEADKQISDMLSRGVIEPSNSPCASPIVLVKKSDGSYRFCVDFRSVNDVTIRDAYPLPKIVDTLDMLFGSTLFSTYLYSGFWQIAMDDQDKFKTAFCTGGGGGLYHFNVLPFGLTTAPASFERLMELVLCGLHWEICLVYLDDVVVFGRTYKEHMARLDTVMTRLSSAGLKLKPRKCKLLQTEVAYLGHRISAEGISTDPEKVKAVQEWPIPTCVTEVRAFLGLVLYYRRFIKNFSQIAKQLHRLTENNRKFHWTEECRAAFTTLKGCLVESPILAYQDPALPFILDTDASDFAIGAVLSQVQNGVERPIAYGSRTLDKAQRQYCVTRKELLAIVYFVKHFRHYLYGSQFLLRTDHGALRWLFQFKDPQGQVARWLEVLSTYTFEIQHRPGVLHGNADGVSRIPCK